MHKTIIAMIFIIGFLVNKAIASNGGRTVGNGGDVLKCVMPSTKKENFEILDWYEGRAIRGLRMDLGEEQLPLDEKIKMAMKRLYRLSPDRSNRYKEHLDKFFSETKWLTDGVLVDIPDSDHIAIPGGCEILQIANQSTPILSTEKRYIIDQKLWMHLNKDQQAALLLHEVIYREAIELGQINSISSRVLNALILSSDIEALSVEEFTNILKELGFKQNRVQGVQVDLNQYEFFDNGNLKSAKVVPNSTFEHNEDSFLLRDKILFYENGIVQSFTPIQNSILKYKGNKFTILPFPVEYYPNGILKTLMLNKNNLLSSQKYQLSVGGVVKFYENGNLKISNVEAGKILLSEIDSNFLLVKDIISFYPNGNLEQTVIDTPYGLSNFNDRSKNWLGPLRLDQNGKVLTAVLRQSIDVFIQEKKVKLSPFVLINFWSETGKIKSAEIQSPITLLSQNNKLIKLEPYSNINLDLNERLIY